VICTSTCGNFPPVQQQTNACIQVTIVLMLVGRRLVQMITFEGIYIYIYRERERERESDCERDEKYFTQRIMLNVKCL
jgi:hypothetical protein